MSINSGLEQIYEYSQVAYEPLVGPIYKSLSEPIKT